MSTRTTTPQSVTGAAIRQAALTMGLPDPMAIADDLLGVDVDALDEWFTIAARAQIWLWQGSGRLSDALPLLAGGWSATAPRLAISRQRQAGLASRDIIGAHVDAADGTAATLRQSRLLADDAVADATGRVRATGWPPGTDLLTWAAEQHRTLEVSGIIAGLCHRLTELQLRNVEALQVLAAALRADPRDPVEQLAITQGSTAVPPSGSPTSLPAGPAGGPGTAARRAAGVDAGNLDRLAQDLQSTDAATLAMALGVFAALDRARTEGGVAQLLVYESANSGSQGRAAISVGDVSTADNVAVLAPGVSNAPVNIVDGIADAVALRTAAQSQAPGDPTAVVVWYGYDIPLSALTGVPNGPLSTLANAAAALNDGNAQEGGARLVADIDQFRQLAPEAARFVTVGFSMGSTTVSAATARGARVDDMVLLGSPGAGGDVERAADYPELSADHTFVVAFDQDPITQGQTDMLAGLAGSVGPFPFQSSPFGPDPASAEFGAQVIDVQTNNPIVHLPEMPFLPFNDTANDLLDLAATHQESNYLSGSSLAAVAAVVNGRYSEVPIKPGR